MPTEILTTLIAILATSIIPLLAKIVGDFLKMRRGLGSNYTPVKIKVGHDNREFEFEVTKDLKEEDIDRIVKYLTDIKEIEQTPPATPTKTIDTDKIENSGSNKTVDVEEI
jgi:hypothetical protein